jgi:hypothetical protein|tara:strand:+ start:2103 stop:5108 length:3006 start_codon:yes stop_codon:yes gene_type:complete
MYGVLCGLKAFAKKRKDDITPENKERIANKMSLLAQNWQSGEYKNVKDAKWNNFDTFESLWLKYTHKPLDFSEFPANFRDVRKFEFGLQYYDKLIAKPQGFFASKFHLPRAAMQNIPELKRFETELINENSFFRDYSIQTGKQVNEILDNFKSFSLLTGEKFRTIRGLGSAGQKRLRTVQNEYDILTQKLQATTDPRVQAKLSADLRKNRADIIAFYESGSGKAFKIINSVLQGADIESIPDLTNQQRTHLNKIKDNYVEIRKSGVTGLIRGLEKIRSMAKDKDLEWVDSTVKRINSLIKAIEFQHVIDENGKVTEYKYLQSERDFLTLGFETKNPADRYVTKKGEVSFSKNYMSQYTLGILKTIKKLEKAVDNRELSLTEEIKSELDSWDSIVNVAKKRNPIINPVYDNDPYFFIRKYASDVGIFNYKAHVKSTFKKATDAIIMEHLDPAKEAGNKNVQEAAESMLKVIKDVYDEIQTKDPTKEGFSSDMMRLMTSITYFRLMGGNVRSALRNGTQRMYEWIHFGLKASLIDSRKFYNQSGLSEVNQSKLNKQLKRFGLQWFDGKTKTSNAWDTIKGGGKAKISEGTRGALEDAYMMDKELYITADGELTIKGGDRISEKAARVTGSIARGAGTLHRIVEDWNRGKTFKVAFALASQNLQSTNKSWQAREILGKDSIDKIKERKGEDYSVGYKDLVEKYGKDTQSTIDNWIENTAGQISYNSTLDLHFEYAKWAKARAIKATDDDSRAAAFVKVGLGQFAHYKFNMVNLMNKWATEAGLSYRALDFTSQEAIRPLRFALLQASIWGATIAGRTNFAKLAPNDVIQTGEAMYTWLTSKRELLTEGSVSPETEEKLRRVTYGAGGWSLLGPNVQILAGAYELFNHAEPNASKVKDPRTEFLYEDSVHKSIKKDENQELYKKIALINSQAARSGVYTWKLIKGGGSLADIGQLEFGLFPSKEHRKLYRDWIPWAKKPKKRKKLIKKTLSENQREAAVEALTGL